MPRLLAAVVRWFVARNEGAAVVEYAVGLLLIVVVTLAMIGLLGNALSGVFSGAAGSI